PLPGDGSGGRRAHPRPPAARPARPDPGDLGRRVRTHAHERRTLRRIAGTGPSPTRVHHVARRRRHRSGDHSGGDGRPRATDDRGYTITEDPVHVHDLHATILDLMGLDHTKLTYRYQGRAFRLTDTSGKVIRKLQA